MSTFLILIFAAFFMWTFPILWRRDIVFGGVYGFLFVYTIFSQLGYAYFPELSAVLGAYFGPEVLPQYVLFVWASMASYLGISLWYTQSRLFASTFEVSHVNRIGLFLGFLWLVVTHEFVVLRFLAEHFDTLNYVSASDELSWSKEHIDFAVFIIVFKFQKVLLLILYFVYRLRIGYARGFGRSLVAACFLIEGATFSVAVFLMANRTDVLSLGLGIGTLEYLRARAARMSFKKVFSVAVAFVAVVFVLSLLEDARNLGTLGSGVERVVNQDYFSPSHILITAMANEYSDPVEVLKSNLANSLMLLNYPYLQQTVMDLFIPGIASRSQGYAFYILAEGYLAFGSLGFIYNALAVALGVALWRKLASSNNEVFSMFALALIATQFANVVRGQSSYFIKDLYVFFLPAMIMFYLATGLRPRIWSLTRKRTPLRLGTGH